MLDSGEQSLTFGQLVSSCKYNVLMMTDWWRQFFPWVRSGSALFAKTCLSKNMGYYYCFTRLYLSDSKMSPTDYISAHNYIIKWAAAWQNQQMTCVPSKDSDQPGHLPSLIRVFAVCMKKPWSLAILRGHEDWSEWADAQADLSLCWVHRSFCWFCRGAVQIILMSA